MKNELKRIYQELSCGKLSKDEALEKIKSIKMQGQNDMVGTLLATPVWSESSIAASSNENQLLFEHQNIVLLGFEKLSINELQKESANCNWIQLLVEKQISVAEIYMDTALKCFEIIQNILNGKPEGKILFQIVISITEDQSIYAGLMGLLKTATLENPKFVGQLIFTDPDISENELVKQVLENKANKPESMIKYVHSKRYVSRWTEEHQKNIKRKIPFKDRGVYLVTGGLGGLGILLAKEIIKNTKKAKIILIGRSELTNEKKKVLDELLVQRKTVEYRQVDISKYDQVKDLIGTIISKYKQINGVIHSAGVNLDNFIIKKTPDEFRSVMLSKVNGAYNLDLACQNLDLDFMVFFSSVSSVLGNLGQADYAAANGFMDQYAISRNQIVNNKRRGRILSINWPFWQDGGMSIEPASLDVLRSTIGLSPIQTTSAFDTLYRCLNLVAGQILVMEGDFAKIRNTLEIGLESKHVIRTIEQKINTSRQVGTSEINEISLIEKTQEFLCKQFSSLLKMSPNQIDPQAPLEKYGIDSIMAMNMTNQLEKTFGTLSKTLFFEYQNIRELTSYMIKSHADTLRSLFSADVTVNKKDQSNTIDRTGPTNQPVNNTINSRRLSRLNRVAPTVNTQSSTVDDTIAIIGLSGRYPESENIQEFWRNLRDGNDCIIEVPKERWDWRKYYSEDRTKSGRHYSKWGGFIKGVDEFDPRFFNISPREAESIDPQERLFLQHAWMAIEDAGYTRSTLQIPHENDLSGQVGVYAGVMYGEYNLSGCLASIANRVSYVLNLHGPSITLDTMCSSSLTAIHLACQDLKNRRTNMAIAGGVNVTIHPNKYMMLSAGQFISSDGHCHSFGEGGDGYIPGEGVGVIILKRLSEAQRDGNHIYAIIRGCALNHGGKTNGYTVPNPHAQASAISKALEESKTDPRHISYLEAHGTGTKLGDPIEITALSKAFSKFTNERGFCLIGSAKSNIGHCESAAGIAGLTKVLLQMKYQQIVPSLHSKKLNPHIDFEKTPFIVNQNLVKWERPVINNQVIPRIAGISSFGAGGSNAHIIVQEYVHEIEIDQLNSVEVPNTKVIIPLSARTKEQLLQKAQDLLNFIQYTKEDNAGKQISLIAMAYTLQIGRESMDERLGFIVSTVDQLAGKLNAYIKNESHVEDIYQGQAKRNKESFTLFTTNVDLQQTVETLIESNQISKLLELWVHGLDLDWNKLYGDIKPARISLPHYPFAKERYWNDKESITDNVLKSVSTNFLHPLLHINTSDLMQQSYTSTFTGEEYFLCDFKVETVNGANQIILPAAICLEMALAAIEKALPVQELRSFMFQDIVWAHPFEITANNPLTITLFPKDNNKINFEIFGYNNSQEIVCCQGHTAIVSSQSIQSKLDIERLKKLMNEGILDRTSIYGYYTNLGFNYGPSYQALSSIYKGKKQLLAYITLPAILESSAKEYKLHPILIDSVFQAAIGLFENYTQFPGYPSLPLCIDSIRTISDCKNEIIAWVRLSNGTSENNGIKLDIDLCDEFGNVCIQICGVAYQDVQKAQKVQELHVNTFDSLKQNISKPTALVSRQIIVPSLEYRKKSSVENPLKEFNLLDKEKPSGITLVDPNKDYLQSLQAASIEKPVVILQSVFEVNRDVDNGFQNCSVDLYDCGNGMFAIHIGTFDCKNKLSKELIERLLQVIEAVLKESSVKVLTLFGSDNVFLNGGRSCVNDAIELKLYQAIIDFPYPIIAAMKGNAIGAGFLVGALCDFMICNKTANYYYTDIQEGLYPTNSEDNLLKKRFGEVLANDFLYINSTFTGEHLKLGGWTCPILPLQQVDEYAQILATTLSNKSQESLRLLKKHMARHMVKLVNELETGNIIKYDYQKVNEQVQLQSKAKNIHQEIISEKVLLIRIAPEKKASEIKTLVTELRNVFSQISKKPQFKSIILINNYFDLMSDKELVSYTKLISDFGHILLESPVPVIASLETDTKGVALFLSQFCDACVYSEKGKYSVGLLPQDSDLLKQAAMIYSYRFGNNYCKEFMFTCAEYYGSELKQKIASLNVVEQDLVLSRSIQIANGWVNLPIDTLVNWKKQIALKINERVVNLPIWLNLKEKNDQIVQSEINSPNRVTLQSKVVTATAHPEGIVVVKMEDRDAKNMFSEALTEGLEEVFRHIEQCSNYKVVVITGFDNYFASGGTKETLLAIQEGKVKFTDNKVYQLTMTCKIPVIAAMQGHGIGAGWSLGMFADKIVFSKESKYVSPYMNYGFTPGAGSTIVFQEKIGYDLAKESLLTAQEYSGGDLKNRGMSIPVMSKGDVLPFAVNMAKQIACNSRDALIGLKHQLTQHLFEQLDETYSLELEMHEKTFVRKDETLQQIHNNFMITDRNHKSIENLVDNKTQLIRIENDVLNADSLSSVSMTLRNLLAHELHMQEDEINEETQFVDLGLDSIMGVTWIRKVNEKYKTTIEATKIYSYPNLNKLSKYVKEEAEKVGTLTIKTEATMAATSANENPIQNEFSSLSNPSDSEMVYSVSGTLKKLLAQELHLQECEINDDAQFVDLGLDSIMGVTWIRKVNEKYKTSIEATKIYSFPTINKLSHFVKEEAQKIGSLISKTESPLPISSVKKEQSEPSANQQIIVDLSCKKLVSWRNGSKLRLSNIQPTKNDFSLIAVIGMAGQFPQSKNIEEFWDNIANGKDCIVEVPKKRWDLNTFYKEGEAVAGKTNCKWVGALDEYDMFDPLFFNISPSEAEYMDPQQRVLLQTCWHSIENAGYNPKELSGSKCGVFVGCAGSDYLQMSKRHQLSAQGFTGGASSITVARISYFLNLQGPCIAIDTACSSSLVAIANACESLNSGASDLALAGGVYIGSGPTMHIMSSQTGMLSRDGRCFSFDQRANGFVPGEGVGVVMLKRLEDAQKDHDIIFGVIEGWGINQDGKSNGITAPNAEAQTRLQQFVYDKFNINPENIQLIEAHGTGTKLGDPIEVDALKQSFSKYTKKTEFCALGSVKSNIGHCLTAAGVAGFIKLIMAINSKKLPPTINYQKLNEHISVEGSPFFINDRLQAWEPQNSTKRQAAISAFGFGGTNAHVVVSEYQSSKNTKPAVTVIAEEDKTVVLLSARTAEQLKQKAVDLKEYIQKKGNAVDLIDMAYTLQVGREAMGERLGFMVKSIDELRKKIELFINGEQDIDGFYQGQVKRNKDGMSIISHDVETRETIIDNWINKKKISKLLAYWVKGLDFDWNKLYGDVKPTRTNLPEYPFAKERYWIENGTFDTGITNESTISGDNIDSEHPFLQRNTSNFNQQSYSSKFSGEEFFLKNYTVNDRKIFPLMSFLEMARAAIVRAAVAEESNILELYNVRWNNLFEHTKNSVLNISLFENDDDRIEYEIYSTVNDENGNLSEVNHCQGEAVFSTDIEHVCIDLDEIKNQMHKGKIKFYDEIPFSNVYIGEVFQCIKEVYKKDNELLVKLGLPVDAENMPGNFFLHPSFTECLFHACAKLTIDLNVSFNQQLLPVSIDTLSVISPCVEEMYAWVRFSGMAENNEYKFDVDLTDLEGNCCMSIQGLLLEENNWSSKTVDESLEMDSTELSELVMMTPKWDVVRNLKQSVLDHEKDSILIISEDKAHKNIFETDGESRITNIEITPNSTVENIVSKINNTIFDRIIWIAPIDKLEMINDESIIDNQHRGLYQVFRILKSLKSLGYEKKIMKWDLITFNSQLVKKSDKVNPTHASLLGFTESMAKEFPYWKVRLLDMQELTEHSIRELSNLPYKSEGASYAYRDGEWLIQKLIPLKKLMSGEQPYRNQGVYVVIGGSGGIGAVWSQYVIDKYDAQVVWIGRREIDAGIQQKIDELSKYGKKPDYLRADASNLRDLQVAYEIIKKKYSHINGVIHSAVGTFDENLKSVSEETFKSIISVKLNVSVRIAQVFYKEDLDFILFFSSNASFVRGGGMSGYSAGCTFKDTYALELSKLLPCAVKVINWGYWAVGAGEKFSDSMKTRFLVNGHRPIEPEEGMKTLELFLSSNFDQLSVVNKLQSTVIDFVVQDEWITDYQNNGDEFNKKQLEISEESKEMLLSNFKYLKDKVANDIEDLLAMLLNSVICSTQNVISFYDRWMVESKKMLLSRGYSIKDENNDYKRITNTKELWDKWENEKVKWMDDGGKKALFMLVEKCLRALPDILIGKQKATDIIFPNSSIELVENVYKTEAISLAFNESIGNVLMLAVNALLKRNPSAQIRVLEIGAGTGSTTIKVLEKLKPYQNNIAEYCYTDISKAFLFHAEKEYTPIAQFISTEILNIEEPIISQNIELDKYDIVIAANVLHATKNIRNTLRNTKAILRKNGILLLNEISEKSLYGHLTFGLLDGWWLNEDDEIRIPGSPGLFPEKWKAILEEEGFYKVLFPTKEVHHLGQQIILAVSDGVVWQRSASKSNALQKKNANSQLKLRNDTTTPKLVDSSIEEKTIAYLKQLIGSVLKINSNQIDSSEPLEYYGLDSIIIGTVNDQLKKSFADISSTLLFEHRTIDAIAKYLIETQKDNLFGLLKIDKNSVGIVQASVIETCEIMNRNVGKIKKIVHTNSTVQNNVQENNIEELLYEKTQRYLKQLIGKILKMSTNQIDGAEPLEHYGIDSIMIGLVNDELRKNFPNISSTLLFEYQTIDKIAKYLVDSSGEDLQRILKLNGPSEQKSMISSKLNNQVSNNSNLIKSRRLHNTRATNPLIAREKRNVNDGPIAVIGISGIYPQASSIEKYWENLKSGRNSIVEIPANRWTLDGFYEPNEQKAIDEAKSYCKWGGFINEFSEFDALFFGISPKDALNMDPQERLFLQEAWRALENSGYTRNSLQKKFNQRVGVFAGVTRPGYSLYGSTQAIKEEKFYPRQSFGSVANRLSYFLDINGPSMPIDTMCSSSLVAIHEACEHIHRGECDLAFAGGVTVYTHPSSYVDMAAQHMFSKDGLCKSFGAGGNGFVPGEGVGVVLLRPLADAIRDNDIIHGVILSTSTNHGGKTNGYTVPNPRAQGELISRAIDKAGINARDISYIEAHGTGTELGDPIEISGLQQAFSKHTHDTEYCKIGSAKSNIGHLEAAAGIASFTKVLLQFKHQQIVPSLHSEQLNPHINFKKTPFVVNQVLSTWQRPLINGKEKPRIAGISGFGAGGANAHVIVQEYIPPTDIKRLHKISSPINDVIIPLSAKSEEQLMQKVVDLLDYLSCSKCDVKLEAIAYTLQIGREMMDVRLGIVINSIEQLIEKLKLYINGEKEIEGVYRGTVKKKNDSMNFISQDDDMREAIDKWIIRNKLSKLIDLWVKGLDLDWDKLYPEGTPKRISLPTYPFVKETYWIDRIKLTGNSKISETYNKDFDSIEDIINKIDNDSIETSEAIQMLRMML